MLELIGENVIMQILTFNPNIVYQKVCLTFEMFFFNSSTIYSVDTLKKGKFWFKHWIVCKNAKCILTLSIFVY